MTPFDPAQALADGFAAQVEAWAVQLGAAALAAQTAGHAARALSLASSQGHVCWPLAEVAAAHPGLLTGPQSWAQTLLAAQVVDTAAAPSNRPMVLDDEGRLYLHRDFDHERALARRLLQAAQRHEPGHLPPEVPALLQRLFPAPPDGLPNWQQLAAALALRQRLLIISGGPGTGKTTTVVQLLALLLASQPGCRIALAAPTGKAAARMAEALQARASGLPEALRRGLPTQASTVHRLLGPTPTPGVFRHHAGQPLLIDALVVDEASMLDLALARRLLDAVPAHARVVLLGDKDQLSAVESGAVFSDLSANPALSAATRSDLATLCGLEAAAIVPPAAARADDTPLPDSVVWLTQNHRFAADSAIGQLAQAVQTGQAATALALLQGQSGDALRWSAPGLTAAMRQAEDGYAHYLDSLLLHPGDPAAAHAAFSRFRLLCALREGPSGVQACNARLARHAVERLGALQPPGRHPTPESFAGRPVMVLRNDPTLGLFNGDIGITLAAPGSGDLLVWFPDAAASGGFRAIAAARLPAHDTAFAMSVHKAQGSEFDTVMVLLPAQPSRVLTRELLYTAITRARSSVWLVASAERVAEAVATPTQRHSGLSARLRQVAGELSGSAAASVR